MTRSSPFSSFDQQACVYIKNIYWHKHPQILLNTPYPHCAINTKTKGNERRDSPIHQQGNNKYFNKGKCAQPQPSPPPSSALLSWHSAWPQGLRPILLHSIQQIFGKETGVIHSRLSIFVEEGAFIDKFQNLSARTNSITIQQRPKSLLIQTHLFTFNIIERWTSCRVQHHLPAITIPLPPPHHLSKSPKEHKHHYKDNQTP